MACHLLAMTVSREATAAVRPFHFTRDNILRFDRQ
jgi:hypothetical protein